MEKYITFNSQEHHKTLLLIYYRLCESGRLAALSHVYTIKDNNSFHYTHLIENLNEAITKLIEFYHKTDNRINDFKMLDNEKLIIDAKKFLTEDIDY